MVTHGNDVEPTVAKPSGRTSCQTPGSCCIEYLDTNPNAAGRAHVVTGNRGGEFARPLLD
jgi:hypothetical protein